MHIAKNEECKIFYGSRFDKMKKNHKRLRMQFLREEKGTKKELREQREKYALNPEIGQKKKNYYQKEKKKQAILQKEKEKKEERMRQGH